MPEPQAAPPAAVTVLIRDLIFSSRVSATARQLGVSVNLLRDPAQLAAPPEGLPDEARRRLIVDLNLDGAIEAAAAWRRAVGDTVIGFVSHVDTDTIARARAAGIDRIVARSQFVQILPELLQG